MPPLELSQIRVLLVEDDEFMRQLMARLLVELRVREVATAADGKDAAERLELLRLDVDLIICDIMMPNVSGLQFVKSVRAGRTRCHPEIPVLLLTGVGDEEVVREAAKVGIHGYVKKPVSKETLRRRIATAMRNPMVKDLSGELPATDGDREEGVGS